MLNVFYQLFLTMNATLLIIVVFLIKVQVQIGFLASSPRWISYIIFICIPILLTGISLLLTHFLSDDNIEGNIRDVEQANNAFLPSYLGYFFVALSVPYCETLIFTFSILFVFTYFSQTLYFNPLFLLWGYQFYYITTENNVKIFLISKKLIRSTQGLSFPKLKRINNFTFIDMGGK
ncbi:MAG: hypothetical protein P4L59_06325 [Desulfosporosinus sp.]|nr:hypothetical protein [Desulfosporosinus sp.]